MKYHWIKSTSIYGLLGALLITGCDLEELPIDTADRVAVFGSESGLELYANSFYDWMPTANNIHQADAISDYSARRNVPDFLRPGEVYNARSTDNTSASGYDLVAIGGMSDSEWNWGWRTLRNLNYFLVNNTNEAIPWDVRRHYNGLAKFFRAWFYFEKVKRYGDVPWINRPLDVEDPELYSGRDSRVLVMDSVMADINYAIANIREINDNTRTLISPEVALALKSRIALFEGTFRKYHTELSLTGTADAWLSAAVSAAEAVITSGKFSLYTGAGEDMSYRTLFISDDPVQQEIMLTVASSTDLNVRHAANWYFTSATTGIRFSFIRQFINTYLKIDGTPFTDTPGYETMTFMDEVKGRDKRLQQTIRMGDYKRISGASEVPAPPAFTYTYTGYQPIKWSLDNISIDGGNNNTNAVSVFRYAEVLLNYAEAKAELGTITNEDWAETVGALRARAGITDGLTTLPAVMDPYLQTVYFPDITDPVIAEVRRERGIELAIEGFRFYDVVRWKRGELMEMEWRGFYVPQADQPMDLNEDGIQDVFFYTTLPGVQEPGITYININSEAHKLANGTSGEITWLSNIPREWTDKKYYYPIPETHLLTNPDLGQNAGW